jgi:hypothetical protein
MFVRVKKIGAYEYLYLVENVREGGRHVQRVVKSLGRRDEVEASGMLDGLIASAAKHSRRTVVLSSFYRGELPELRRVSIGPDLVFGRLWAETGCRDVLRGLLAGRRFGFDVERAVYLTVLHRLMVSGSDRHASEWRNGLRVPGAEYIDLDQAYKAMAWLGVARQLERDARDNQDDRQPKWCCHVGLHRLPILLSDQTPVKPGLSGPPPRGGFGLDCGPLRGRIFHRWMHR